MRLFVRGRSLGIQARLTVLAIATALPLVALAGFAILRMVDDQRTSNKTSSVRSKIFCGT
jgi:hypothetical protein